MAIAHHESVSSDDTAGGSDGYMVFAAKSDSPFRLKPEATGITPEATGITITLTDICGSRLQRKAASSSAVCGIDPESPS